MTRLIRCLSLFCTALLLPADYARAHFLWLDAQPLPNAAQQIRLWFSDGPQPGRKELIAKVMHTKVWIRDAGGGHHDLTLRQGSGADEAALTATCERQDGACVEATCDYGVYQHDSQSVCLNYYAKSLPPGWTLLGDKFARSKALVLDIVPQRQGQSLGLGVFFRGEPAAGSEIVVVDPAGARRALKTDSHGHAALQGDAAGHYAIRAAVIEADRGGRRDGKAFQQTWHYCTATFDLPSPAQPPEKEPTALETLLRARKRRAVWKDFPGFTANVTVFDAGQQQSGKVSIDASGSVDLDMPASSGRQWAQEQLESMVQHRMPDGQVAEGKVTYADTDRLNPLGRKILLGDAALQSSYRIKDGAITEVSRSAGPSRFTISVLETEWNSEKKYLPRSFVVNFFDSKTGELRTSLGYRNEWQRVGTCDIPRVILEVTAEKGSTATRQIVLENVRLATKK